MPRTGGPRGLGAARSEVHLVVGDARLGAGRVRRRIRTWRCLLRGRGRGREGARQPVERRRSLLSFPSERHLPRDPPCGACQGFKQGSLPTWKTERGLVSLEKKELEGEILRQPCRRKFPKG